MTNFLASLKTLTGISAQDIPTQLGVEWPQSALKKIPYGPMSGKTDIRFNYVRDRFDEVFGPHGIGWRIVPHERLGKVECRFEERAKTDKQTGEIKNTVWYTVIYTAHVFEYCVQSDDGIDWISTSPMSDSDENVDEGYAYRGAFTSLLKQVLRGFGGMNRILTNQQTHEGTRQAPPPPAPKPEPKREEKPVAPVTHWAKDADKVAHLVTAMIADFKLDEAFTLDDAETMANYGSEKLKVIENFVTGKELYAAVKVGVGNWRAAQTQEPDAPKDWWMDEKITKQRDDFLSQWGQKAADALVEMENFAAYADYQKAVRDLALANEWPIAVSHATVQNNGLGKGGTIFFDTALGRFSYYSRTKFEDAMKAVSENTVQWNGVGKWEDGLHVLPEPIVVHWKNGRKTDGTHKFEIDHLAVFDKQTF